MTAIMMDRDHYLHYHYHYHRHRLDFFCCDLFAASINQFPQRVTATNTPLDKSKTCTEIDKTLNFLNIFSGSDSEQILFLSRYFDRQISSPDLFVDSNLGELMEFILEVLDPNSLNHLLLCTGSECDSMWVLRFAISSTAWTAVTAAHPENQDVRNCQNRESDNLFKKFRVESLNFLKWNFLFLTGGVDAATDLIALQDDHDP